MFFRAALLLSVTLMGCASSPPQVYASRDLVEDVTLSPGTESVNDSLGAFFERAQAYQSTISGGETIVFKERYNSALGIPCVKYRVKGMDSVACKQNDKWLRQPSVVQAANAVKQYSETAQ